MVSTTGITGAVWQYQLAPLHELPDVDLAVSLKSRFVHNRFAHQVLRAVAISPITFVAYMIYMVTAFIVFFVPASVGRPISIVGFVLGLPASIVSLANLRYEMGLVLLQTYDIWFSSFVSALSTSIIAILFQDSRAAVIFLSWLAFTINVFVDASIFAQRNVRIANLFSAICFMAIAGAVGVQYTDQLHLFEIFRVNSHVLPASAVARDCLTTVVVVLFRNVVRKNRGVVTENTLDIATVVTRCVTFRCQLQIQEIAPSQHGQNLHGQNNLVPLSPAALSLPSRQLTTVRFQFAPFLQCFDVRDTLFPLLGLSWRGQDENRYRHVWWLGIAGFALTNLLYMLDLLWPTQTTRFHLLVLAVLGASASCIFLLITTATMQRQLLHALVTSFDFIFIAIQLTIVHFALADILFWRSSTVVVVFSNLLWSLWLLCWDSITPPARLRLGLSHRFVVWIGPPAAFLLCGAIAIIFIVRPPDTINDRVFFTVHVLNRDVQFRALTWYFSSATTVSTWAIRIVWRMIQATDKELVVLDGTVFYESRQLTRRGRERSMANETPVPQFGAFPVVPLS